MTLLILSFLSKNRLTLLKNKIVHLFLILAAMLISSSASPQVFADFTTLSVNTGCGSLTVEFKDLSTGAPNAWLWDFGNGNSSTLKDPTVIYANSGDFDVTLLVFNSTTNDSKTSNAFIQVFDIPNSEISANSLLSGCKPLKVNFEDSSSTNNSIVNWQWDFGDGGSSNLQSPIYNFVNDGSFSVSLLVVDENGCQSLSTQQNLIQVYEVPIADFTADFTFFCDSSEIVTFINSSTGLANYIWDFGDGSTSDIVNPIHNYYTGVYSVSLLANIGSCVDTLTLNNYIEVGGELNSDFITDNNIGCQGLQVNFTDITQNSPDTWLWNFGDGSTSNLQNPMHIYLNPGNFDVSLTTAKGGQCIDTKITYGFIQIFENPHVQITADSTYSCSVPFNVEFFDITTDAISWDWDFGNGINSLLSTAYNTYSNYGSYDFKLIVKNSKGCSDTAIFIDFIEVEEIIIDVIVSEIKGCTPFNVSFFDSTNSIRPIIDWNWSFGDGNSSINQSTENQYITADSFDVSLSVINDYGCVASRIFTDIIKVYEIPQVDFQASHLISCAGQDINFSDLTLSASSLTNWFWDFGDGSISSLQNPVFQYQLTGTYDISLIAESNNCSDTFKILNYIEIIEPSAKFIEEYDCESPLKVDFESFSIGADDMFWDFGDGNTSTLTNPTHTYAVKGLYNVSLFVINDITGCSHEYIKPIKLTIPKASFDYLINPNNGYEDSLGCAPKRVYLNNTSQDMSYFKVLWSDGFIGYGLVDHLITNAGQFDVTMIVSDIHQCKDTMIYNNMFRISDVEADFEIVNVLGCDSMLVDFEDLSSPASSVIWHFGDGGISTLNNPQHIYYSEGYFDVTLYAESADGCKDTLERLEYIQLQYPNADFTSNIQGICPLDSVQFFNLSDGIDITSAWDFGDGYLSTQTNPSHSFISNGIYDISLLITDSFNCTNNMVLTNHIEVLKPTADFTNSAVSSNCPPLISSFTNNSSNDAINWDWVFSNGGNSSITNPSHLFANSGIFDVTLIVENLFGCKDTLVQNGLVNVSGPIGSFSISDSLICKNDSVQFIPLVINTDNFLWDFGNGVLSTDSFPFSLYSNDGLYFPSLIIENASGCQFTINNSDTILVHSVNIDAGIDIEICEGDVVQLNAIGDATNFTWTPALALNDSNIFNPIANPTNDNMYFIHHSDGICEATDSIFVKVNNDVPVPTFTSFNHCDGEVINFIGNSGLLNSNIGWEWSFGSNINNPVQQLNLGVNAIQLIVVNLDNNCSDTLVSLVEVYPLPTAIFMANEVCLGEPTIFKNNSSDNVVDWQYTMNDGIGSSSNISPNYTYLNSGVYYPTLVVNSDFGCTSKYTAKIKINELPIANFLVEDNCVGKINTFTDMSTISNGLISNWQYSFGDGTNNGFSFNEQHQYILSGVYDVSLNVISEKGCIDSIVKETSVYDNPLIDFMSDQYCLGKPTNFSNFSIQNNGSIKKWEWGFGDSLGNTSSEHPSYTYKEFGDYSVTLTVTSDFGCVSSLIKNISIIELPVANFIVDPTVCLGDEIRFIDKSVNNTGNLVSWNWNLGNSLEFTSQNLFYEYENVNKYDVTLTVISDEGCIHDTTILDAVEVFSKPVADFNASNYSATELNSEINFYNISSGEDSYFWDFDNGMTSSEINPVINFSDVRIYEVLLTVLSNDGCKDEMIKTINITPKFTLFTPNSFTPNGDGDNDVFLADGNGVDGFKMLVFDRWGGVVFQSSSIEHGWDGLDANSNLVVKGKYMYHISLYDYNGKLWVYNGEINLMR